MFYQNSSYIFKITMLLVVILVIGCADKVVILNDSGNENGLLVDGANSSGHVNDRKRVSSNTKIDVGSLKFSSSTNDIISITKNRPVAIKENAAWTSSDDEESITFANKLNIPITVWIVKGPFADQRTKAINACIYTTGRFYAERVGIGFSQFEIIDKTGMSNAGNFYHFPSSADPQDWKDVVGWKNDRINIYYLETVSGSMTTGRAVNFTNFIVLGQNFGDIAVVHEIGHSLSARHKSAPNFNTDCIMWPFYNTADPWEFFSEGELFRMHANTTSALNSVYNARPLLPQRSCVGNVSSDECVDWDRRLWDDGILLAN